MYNYKKYPKSPKRKKKRYHMKPASIDSMATGILARHNIARQVTSAMIVKSVNAFITENVEPHIQTDAQALSHVDGVVRIACKNPSASFAMQDYVEPISNHLKRAFPGSQVDSVVCILNQDPWMKYGDDVI